MRKKLLIGFAVLAAIVVVFAIVVALQPSDYRVARSTTIAVPPADAFAQVNDFHNWQAWSPWANIDPNCKYTFEGASQGTGAIFAWDGNDEVGAGSMKITDSDPFDRIQIQLDFIRPFEDSASVEFAFEPVGDETRVTWTMFGHNNFIGKIFCLFMDMDQMLGADFEKGLAQMKTAAEAASQQ